MATFLSNMPGIRPEIQKMRWGQAIVINVAFLFAFHPFKIGQSGTLENRPIFSLGLKQGRSYFRIIVLCRGFNFEGKLVERHNLVAKVISIAMIRTGSVLNVVDKAHQIHDPAAGP